MNINNSKRNTVYGHFPETPGNSARINIDSDWLKANTSEYKKLGQTYEKCEQDLTYVVTDELFLWETPEMELQFHKDIKIFFNQ